MPFVLHRKKNFFKKMRLEAWKIINIFYFDSEGLHLGESASYCYSLKSKA